MRTWLVEAWGFEFGGRLCEGEGGRRGKGGEMSCDVV